jgi:transcriptional regulator with XRE-family HTH domain
MRKSARDIVKINLGRQARELRLSSKMSLADLADEAKTRRALISEIERGEANPTLDSLINIAMALGVDLADPISRSTVSQIEFATGTGYRSV